MQFHISYSAPSDVWSTGFWALYQITGDEIAKRIKLNEDGKVVERHSWCGYVCGAGSLDEIMEAIKRLSES